MAVEQAEQPATRRIRARLAGSRRALVAGLVVVIVAIAAAVFFLRSDEPEPLQTATPTELSIDELRSFADSLGHPVYWAGATPGLKLEVTRNTAEQIFIRYLPESAPIGDTKPHYTTVATYPAKDAYDQARRAGRRRGSRVEAAPGGGIAVSRRDRRTSVYLAYPGSDYLVEVYAPGRGEARDLALSGRVVPIR